MTTEQRVKEINRVLDLYFKTHNEQIPALELMQLFVENGIFKKDYSNGLPIRELLRELDSYGELEKIPYVVAERKGTNTNWYFALITSSTIKTKAILKPITKTPCADDIEKALINGEFLSVNSLSEATIPDKPGLYCIKIRKGVTLPTKYGQIREDGIIYIGKAKRSIRKRLWRQELNHDGAATFFRSIGAMLDYLPPKGSLIDKDTRNYTFSEKDTDAIRKWMKTSLLVRYVLMSSNIEEKEKELIRKYCPLVNIKGNPNDTTALEEARKRCDDYAKS